MKKPVKLIIADDHILFIDGLKLLLQSDHNIQIIDIANDGKELLDLLENKRPEIILLDINMPVINGLEAIKHIKKIDPNIKIIILSTYNEEHLIEKAKLTGANGYLLKNCNRDELLQTIFLVNEGKSCFPFNNQLQAPLNENDHFLKRFNLTKREIEVLHLIKDGNTNKQIAECLYLSIYTVETHRKNILQKLSINSPAALMKYIIENKL